ncbi:LysR family transcriptional regulator [Leisingera thetidis]|uniref:LysR family transcriptional regulator n=1 Tax=Leisingera thetidis TaxID=2930199 RepID=UPI0021F75869|nr:LysR family transcriptional regulator [Leisingera thetidis]
MAQLKLEQIKAFLAVVRAGGINRAADMMNLTQPAVTSRIKSLESTLGTQLFERTGAGVRLTKQGDLLVSYAEQFQQLSQLVEENIMSAEGVEGHLRLGVSETIAQSWLPEFVSVFHRTYPKVKIEISVDISTVLRENLLKREIDLAILLGPVSEYTVENVGLPEVELAWYSAVPADSSTAEPVDFGSTPVISYAKNTRPFRELKAELFKRVGPQVSLFPSSSLSACFRLVEVGLGVAALPRSIGRRYVSEGRIREFNPGWCPGPLRFSASFLGEPKSHLIEMAAGLALQTSERAI